MHLWSLMMKNIILIKHVWKKCLYFLHLKFLNKKLFKQHLSCQFLMKLVFYTLHSPNQKLMSIKSHNNFPIRKTDTCFLQFFTVLNFIKLLFEVLSWEILIFLRVKLFKIWKQNFFLKTELIFLTYVEYNFSLRIKFSF